MRPLIRISHYKKAGFLFETLVKNSPRVIDKVALKIEIKSLEVRDMDARSSRTADAPPAGQHGQSVFRLIIDFL
jgi:hypothetical protein